MVPRCARAAGHLRYPAHDTESAAAGARDRPVPRCRIPVDPTRPGRAAAGRAAGAGARCRPARAATTAASRGCAEQDTHGLAVGCSGVEGYPQESEGVQRGIRQCHGAEIAVAVECVDVARGYHDSTPQLRRRAMSRPNCLTARSLSSWYAPVPSSTKAWSIRSLRRAGPIWSRRKMQRQR